MRRVVERSTPLARRTLAIPLDPSVNSVTRVGRAGVPLLATLWLYPVWWALGVQALAWPLAALFGFLWVVEHRRSLVIPPGFGLWMLFIAWTVISAVVISSFDRFAAWGYREMLYVAATLLFVFLVNVTESELSTGQLARGVAALWFATVVVGFIGIIVPKLAFTSVAELVTPAPLRAIPFIRDQIHPRFGDEAQFLGTVRPAGLYSYTNSWGAALAVLTPLMIYALGYIHSRGWRLTMLITAGLSLIPIVVSVNRGLWIGLFVAAFVVAVRAALARRPALLVTIVGSFVVLLLAVYLTPLRDVVEGRIEKPNTSTRETLVSASLQLVRQSPLVGFGSPVSVDLANDNGVSVGTHGQLWTLLVSHGIPGTLFYFAFLAVALLMTWRIRPQAWWAQAAIVVFATQAPFYNALPVPLMLAMIAITLCLRERLPSSASGTADLSRRHRARVPQRSARAPALSGTRT